MKAYQLTEWQQPPQLRRLHHLRGALHVVGVEAADDLGGHHLVHASGKRVPAVGDRADRDVAVGEHADETAPLRDGQRPHVRVAHQPRGVGERRVTRHGHDGRGHGFRHLH